ncbi:MAG: single-stranded-DNA-specific exonuclease, single-stranded-DNA-specific exonuclease [Candidatus Parcubacteria bacterium]|jgi:single-stranded-DNA-specific exonuclease
MKRYELRQSPPEAVVSALGAYAPIVQTLLYNRGIEAAEAAQAFLEPQFERDVHDPLLLPNMQAAVDRILQAVAAGERITVYADYDADGVPGAAMLTDFFTASGVTFDVYIPHRNREGFGLNEQAIRAIAERGTTLLLTLDCGVADVEEVALARSLGMDVVITDHHEPHDALPPAIIVNHKLKDATYPERILCGTGVAFKLVQALVASGKMNFTAGQEKWFLDLVGIATLSDMVPLVGENRALAHFGLLVLKKTRRHGLRELLRKTGTNIRDITETDIGFSIAPRINAASRMGEPAAALAMLTAADAVSAAEHVAHLHHINDARKGHVAAIVKAVHKKVVEQGIGDRPIVVAGHPEWQPSLLGLAASSIAEHYRKPTFLWGRGDGVELKGSCRTANGISTLAIMQAAADALETFGGHAQAGGFVVARDKVDTLLDALSDGYAAAACVPDDEPEWIDATLALDDVNHRTYTTVRSLAPFGVGNPEPVFLLQNVLVKQVEQFGKTREHLRLVFHRQQGGDVEAIAFYTTPTALTRNVSPGDRRDIVATLDKNTWGSRQSVRLRLKDVL